MPAEEIKPCPFCGSSNIGFIFYDKPLSNCMDCGAEGPINFEGWLDEDCMKAAWNRRADTKEEKSNSAELLNEAIALLQKCCGLTKYDHSYEELHNQVLSFVRQASV